MAVHCGVCAVRISSAPENGGSFRTTDFGGWDERSRISDTCEECAWVLALAVGQAAKEIRKKHDWRVQTLHNTLAAEKTRHDEYEKARREALAEVDRKMRQ